MQITNLVWIIVAAAFLVWGALGLALFVVPWLNASCPTGTPNCFGSVQDWLGWAGNMSGGFLAGHVAIAILSAEQRERRFRSTEEADQAREICLAQLSGLASHAHAVLEQWIHADPADPESVERLLAMQTLIADRRLEDLGSRLHMLSRPQFQAILFTDRHLQSYRRIVGEMLTASVQDDRLLADLEARKKAVGAIAYAKEKDELSGMRGRRIVTVIVPALKTLMNLNRAAQAAIRALDVDGRFEGLSLQDAHALGGRPLLTAIDETVRAARRRVDQLQPPRQPPGANVTSTV